VTPLSGYAHPQFSDAGLQSMLSFGFRSSSLLECILLNQEPLYVLIFMLPLHVLLQMSNHWTFLTLVEIVLTFATVILFSFRKYIEAAKTEKIISR